MVSKFNRNKIKVFFHNSQPSWKCNGSEEDPHPEVSNDGYKCKLCSLTFDDVRAKHRIRTGKKIIVVSSVVAAAAGGLAIMAGLYVQQKLMEADKTIAQLNHTKAELHQVKAELAKVKNVDKAIECLDLLRQINNVVLIGVNFPHEEVMSIQKRLQFLGFYHEQIDGKFGESTVKAVKEFQKSCNLSK